MYLLPRALIELAPGAIWIASFLVVFYAVVIAVFVRHIGSVLKAVLEEPDPRLKDILREVLQDLLDLFRPGRHG
jgi:hypothetical protein